MKYIIIDDRDNDIFTKEFDNKDEAINEARSEWDHLSNHDKKLRNAFYVLESVNPDEDAENHLDGTPMLTLK